jgi:hypothetical protein
MKITQQDQIFIINKRIEQEGIASVLLDIYERLEKNEKHIERVDNSLPNTMRSSITYP